MKLPPLDRATMDRMRHSSKLADTRDRLLGITVACPVCPAKEQENCEGPGVWDGSKPLGVHMGRFKLAIPHPRPARYWWVTAHEEFLAGHGILQPGFDTNL